MPKVIILFSSFKGNDNVYHTTIDFTRWNDYLNERYTGDDNDGRGITRKTIVVLKAEESSFRGRKSSQASVKYVILKMG